MSETKQTFKGSCHCKAVQFEFIATLPLNALQCNCSVCMRKNAIMSKQKFNEDEFTLVSGKDDLSVYHWNDRDVNHYFCKHCGVYPFHDVTFTPNCYRVNLGCVDEIDARALDIEYFDGKNLL